MKKVLSAVLLASVLCSSCGITFDEQGHKLRSGSKGAFAVSIGAVTAGSIGTLVAMETDKMPVIISKLSTVFLLAGIIGAVSATYSTLSNIVPTPPTQEDADKYYTPGRSSK